MTNSSGLKAGDWVQVRTKDEIIRTLDGRGQLDALPFMPEMFGFCGQRFRVFKRAHKTCDSPHGYHGRRMQSAVHLEGLRCNGSAHGGCQHGCLIFWKEAWLKKVDAPSGDGDLETVEQNACSEADVWAGCLADPLKTDPEGPAYVCQSTQLPHATRPLPWWDTRQYLEDCQSGNVRPVELASVFGSFLVHQLASAGIGIGWPVRWIHDTVQRRRGGTPYPFRKGALPRGSKTPTHQLRLQPGEVIRIRSYEEILATIDEDGLNRGMLFAEELVPYCGGTHRVVERVSRIIDEKTGKMLVLKNECIALDGVVCKSKYSIYRRGCPRSIRPFWREIWLERVEQNQVMNTVKQEAGQGKS